jgi:hypothetical protein
MLGSSETMRRGVDTPYIFLFSMSLSSFSTSAVSVRNMIRSLVGDSMFCCANLSHWIDVKCNWPAKVASQVPLLHHHHNILSSMPTPNNSTVRSCSKEHTKVTLDTPPPAPRCDTVTNVESHYFSKHTIASVTSKRYFIRTSFFPKIFSLSYILASS